MANIVFVQGDTAPDIRAVIYSEDDPTSPVDLTGASVRFQMRKPDDQTFTVDAGATIDNPSAGQVSYRWLTNDLAVPGDYDTQWEVTYADLRIQTTARTVSVTVRRQ